jgi:hypothetical protein
VAVDDHLKHPHEKAPYYPLCQLSDRVMSGPEACPFLRVGDPSVIDCVHTCKQVVQMLRGTSHGAHASVSRRARRGV